jgi:hypothetical protein
VGWIGAGIGEFYLVQLGVSIGGTLAAFGPTRLLGFGCISVSASVADCGSALTAGHLFQTPECRPSKKVTEKACSYVRPSQARVPSLQD